MSSPSPAPADGPVRALSLDPDQRLAAEARAASVLVLAGPGTGKTTTLVGRYRHLVDNGTPPARIFVSTFTVRAAAELHRRIGDSGDETPRETVRRLPIGTLHSLAARLLTRFPPPGCPPVRIFDDQACGRLIARHRLYHSDETKRPQDLFGAYKDRLLDPAAAMAEAKAKNEPDLIEAATLYTRYQEVLTAEGGFDFGDLIVMLVRGMETDPDYRARIAGFFDHLLIDEFQDINPAQERMLRLLRDQGAFLWAVGDDDQCLYAWRSADPAFILGFEKEWPDPALFRLSRNYRSTATIVDAAQALIGGNRNRHAKSLAAQNPSRLPVTVTGLEDDEDEAAYVLRVVRGLAGKGVPWHEMAVLYRAGHVGSRLQIALAEAGVPVVVRGAGEFWQLTPVRLTAALIRLMSNPGDMEARALLGHGKRVERLLEQAPDKIDDSAPWPALCRQVGRLVSSTARPPGEEGVQWRDLCYAAADLAAETGGLEQFIASVEEQRRSLRAAEAGGDAVVLSTIHGAKGLEWAAVVVAGCEDELLPHESAPDIEEERRLMYVAVTRARRWLVLSFVAERRKRALPSPFLRELLAGLDPEQIRWNDDDTRRRVQGSVRPAPAATSGTGRAHPKASAKLRKPNGGMSRGKRTGRV